MTTEQRVALAALILAVAAVSAEAEYRNGRFFDPGRQMGARAEGAPAELDRVVGWVGQWDVEIVRPQEAGESVKAAGLSEITFMNRGHALMENLYVEDLAGHAYSALQFLGYNPASERWFLGGADNWTERAWVADGAFEGATLVFLDDRRLGGGVTSTVVRYRFAQPSADTFTAVVETSGGGGGAFETLERRSYKRREASDDLLQPAKTYGTASPDRPREAAAFDFLVGEWIASHDMTFPNGRNAKWQANATAVYALNGAAVLEFNWFDVDPSLPDAATTILRLYNRAQRRWENLYVPNRGHSILYFGGVEEGDEIVLHPFETDLTAGLSKWVFHSIGEDAYKWYANTSSDRGTTWTKTWSIEFERKPPSSERPSGEGSEPAATSGS